jgi:hypothetical protein
MPLRGATELLPCSFTSVNVPPNGRTRTIRRPYPGEAVPGRVAVAWCSMDRVVLAYYLPPSFLPPSCQCSSAPPLAAPALPAPLVAVNRLSKFRVQPRVRPASAHGRPARKMMHRQHVTHRIRLKELCTPTNCGHPGPTSGRCCKAGELLINRDSLLQPQK